MAKTIDGVSAENTRKLVGATYRQLVHWDKTGLLRPSVERAKGRGSRRVYSFEDLVELRVICRFYGGRYRTGSSSNGVRCDSALSSRT